MVKNKGLKNMTFKGDTIIGKPSLAMIEIYIAEMGLFCDANETYKYWNDKEWLTKKGVEPKTLENAIHVYNSIVVQKAVKKNAKALGITKLGKVERKKQKRLLRKQLLAGDNNTIELIKNVASKKKKTTKEKKENWFSYDEQLKDKRWLSFRNFVFVVRGKKCERCGATTNLQVHHPKYKHGRMAWEYTCNDVMVVCGECHMKIHGINNVSRNV